MGYNVYITRTEEWTGVEGASITLEEWQSYVAADPEMRLEEAATLPLREGWQVVYRNEGLAVWLTYSGYTQDGIPVWFDYAAGRVAVKNPDEEILAKMRRIAHHLQARVLGAEGEEYT